MELSLSDLKAELRRRGAKISGRKADLVERLESYKRNDNFGREVLENEYYMTVPPLQRFKDINTDTVMPNITFSSIECYLHIYHQKLTDDSISLYTNRFLKFLRLCCNDQSLYFCKSMCKAQMKKNVSYNIDISFDSDGCICESQCECAAGMGPNAHCKHICAVLYALFKFSSVKEIVTEETCTQKLQTFHLPTAPYTGSPVKTSTLQLSQSIDSISFDPRPVPFRNAVGYPDFFRSVWLNHPSVNDLPISQIYEPANPYALNLDHDYSSCFLSEMWLSTMNITSINEERVKEIQTATIGQSCNMLWKTERCYRIHSSNFGRICKAKESSFPNICSSLLSCPDLQVASIIHGKKYEPIAMQKYCSVYNVSMIQCGIFVSLDNPFLAASPDGLIDCDTLIEIKCPFTARNSSINVVDIDYLEGENGILTLKKNHNYYYQIQGQLYCTKRNLCKFVIYTHVDMKVLDIYRDDQFIAEMVEKLTDFFHSHFKYSVLEKFYYKSYNSFTFS